MGVILRIKGWRSRGLRCPDQDVNLIRTGNSCFAVSLLQMPNGTGKTTTLNLLRAALSGSLEQRATDRPEVVRSYRCIEPLGETGEFVLELMLDERLLTIKMNFNFASGTVAYETIQPSGHTRGFHPPVALRRFLREGFVNFFVFDGELASNLLDANHTNAQDAIEDLFQLPLFTRVKDAVADHWLKSVGDSATETKGLTRRRNRVATLEDRLADLRKERKQALAEYSELNDEDSRLHRQFDERLRQQSRFADRVRAATAAASEAEAAVTAKNAILLDHIRRPHALTRHFSNSLLAFKDNLDRVRLPESAAREFFEELSREDVCVCGRDIGATEQLCIRERAAQYLGSDEVGRINAIKSDIESYVGNITHDAFATTKTILDDLARCRRDRQTMINELELAQRDAVGEDPELKSVRDKLTALSARIKAKQAELSAFDDNDEQKNDAQTTGIKVLERRLKEASKKLDEMRHTMDMKRRKELLDGILDEALVRARLQLNSAVVRSTNERIAELMPFNSIFVSDIDRCLRLEHRAGGSVGETMCVAYAFLSTIFTMTQHDLPFVVDSPANPIDIAVRREVAALLPKLSNQLIAFTISAERQGFLDRLEKAAQCPVQYITLYRTTHVTTGTVPEAPNSVVRTRDGVMVLDRAYFRAFHVEGED